jgi:hypothetical protein
MCPSRKQTIAKSIVCSILWATCKERKKKSHTDRVLFLHFQTRSIRPIVSTTIPKDFVDDGRWLSGKKNLLTTSCICIRFTGKMKEKKKQVNFKSNQSKFPTHQTWRDVGPLKTTKSLTISAHSRTSSSFIIQWPGNCAQRVSKERTGHYTSDEGISLWPPWATSTLNEGAPFSFRLLYYSSFLVFSYDLKTKKKEYAPRSVTMTRRYIKRPPRSLLRARKERRIHNNYKTTHYCIIIILKRETLRESRGNKNQATSQIDEETYCTFVGLPFVFFLSVFLLVREAAETKSRSRCNKL